MIPEKKSSFWENLLLSNKNYQFKSFPLSMMLSRMRRKLKQDSSDANLKVCIEEAYQFFIKFEKILQEDIEMLREDDNA